MSLFSIAIVIIVVGVLLWVAVNYIPMEPPFKKALVAIAVIALVLWILQVFGLLDTVQSVRVGPVRR